MSQIAQLADPFSPFSLLKTVILGSSQFEPGADYSFRGTRIPMQMLIDHVAAGFSLDEFLETVPSLERGQAQRFLELAGKQMKECASSLTSV